MNNQNNETSAEFLKKTRRIEEKKINFNISNYD